MADHPRGLFQFSNGESIWFAIHEGVTNRSHLIDSIEANAGHVDPDLSRADFTLLLPPNANSPTSPTSLITFICSQGGLAIDVRWIWECLSLKRILPWYQYHLGGGRIRPEMDDESRDLVELSTCLGRHLSFVGGLEECYGYLSIKFPHRTPEQFQQLHEQYKEAIDRCVIDLAKRYDAILPHLGHFHPSNSGFGFLDTVQSPSLGRASSGTALVGPVAPPPAHHLNAVSLNIPIPPRRQEALATSRRSYYRNREEPVDAPMETIQSVQRAIEGPRSGSGTPNQGADTGLLIESEGAHEDRAEGIGGSGRGYVDALPAMSATAMRKQKGRMSVVSALSDAASSIGPQSGTPTALGTAEGARIHSEPARSPQVELYRTPYDENQGSIYDDLEPFHEGEARSVFNDPAHHAEIEPYNPSEGPSASYIPEFQRVTKGRAKTASGRYEYIDAPDEDIPSAAEEDEDYASSRIKSGKTVVLKTNGKVKTRTRAGGPKLVGLQPGLPKVPRGKAESITNAEKELLREWVRVHPMEGVRKQTYWEHFAANCPVGNRRGWSAWSMVYARYIKNGGSRKVKGWVTIPVDPSVPPAVGTSGENGLVAKNTGSTVIPVPVPVPSAGKVQGGVKITDEEMNAMVRHLVDHRIEETSTVLEFWKMFREEYKGPVERTPQQWAILYSQNASAISTAVFEKKRLALQQVLEDRFQAAVKGGQGSSHGVTDDGSLGFEEDASHGNEGGLGRPQNQGESSRVGSKNMLAVHGRTVGENGEARVGGNDNEMTDGDEVIPGLDTTGAGLEEGSGGTPEPMPIFLSENGSDMSLDTNLVEPDLTTKDSSNVTSVDTTNDTNGAMAVGSSSGVLSSSSTLVDVGEAPPTPSKPPFTGPRKIKLKLKQPSKPPIMTSLSWLIDN